VAAAALIWGTMPAPAQALGAPSGLHASGFKKTKAPAKGATGKTAKTERVEVALPRADVLDAPRPDARVIGFVVKDEVMPKLDVSDDGNYFKVRYGPFDEGWVDVVAVHESAKPLKMVEAKGRIATGVAGVEAPVAGSAAVRAPAGAAGPAKTAPAGKAAASPAARASTATPAAASRVSRSKTPAAGADRAAPDESAGRAAGSPGDVRPDEGPAAADTASVEEAAAPGPAERVSVGARVGYALFSEHYDSDGAGPFRAYKAGFNQAVAEVAGRVEATRLVAVDGRYALGYSLPTDVTWTDGSNVHVGTATHRFDVGASLAWRMSERLGLRGALRVGFLMARFEMVNASPDNALLTNTYFGATAGLRLEATHLWGGLGFALAADAIVPAWNQQGPYRSGAGSASRGAQLSLGVSWALSHGVAITASYGLTYLHTRFWGDGSRESAAANSWARNDDALHTFELGARLGF